MGRGSVLDPNFGREISKSFCLFLPALSENRFLQLIHRNNFNITNSDYSGRLGLMGMPQQLLLLSGREMAQIQSPTHTLDP